MNTKHLLIFFLVLVTLSCNRANKDKLVRISSSEQLELEMRDINTEDSEAFLPSKCNDPLSNIPYPEELDFWETRVIKVNFHIMNNEKGDQNKVDAYFVKGMLMNANERLLKNRKMNLPEGNETPNLNPYFKYSLTPSKDIPGDDGVYFHADDSLYFYLNKGRERNNYNRDVIKKYTVQKDEVLNIFIMPHHPDSIISKTYKQKSAGIALGNELKLGADFANPKKFWEYAPLLNHEIGHVMSLRHAWTRNDGCDDTPKHANCFSKTKKAPCDGLTSNNVMDYNNSQLAYSPCQIGRIHKVINDINSSQRGLIRPDWCQFNATEEIVITKPVVLNGQKDINKNIVIQAGGKLSLNCRLAMSKNASITVKEGGILELNSARLHNSCGDKWNGIFVEGKGDKRGKIYYNGEVLIEDVLNVLPKKAKS